MISQWKKLILTLTAAACALSYAQAAISPDPYANETKEERDARMGWWREARFGMFIHWGVYAVPAGTYKGKKIPSIGEWIMLKGKIPVAEYKAFAKEFNPVKYDPQAWVQLAKDAGMRYIVITSKHHDGFALFPSAVTDWDIADASPYGKDLIGPLADAARAEGLKFGLYYSQAQDWTHPGGAKARPYEEGGGWDDAHKGDFDQYLKEIAAPQVGEILTSYRPDILWWDTPIWMTEARAERLLPLIRIVPGIITNNRLGGDYKGDTETPEQHIPATGFADRDWEVCMTMNHTWGYKSYDRDWKSAEDLIQKLCDIVSKGGNFLLNVGPTAEGEIPRASIERLKTVGRWMDVNSESIYGTSASPFHRLPWGRATKKIHENGATLYLQVFDWPENGRLEVPGLKNPPASVTLPAGSKPLSSQMENGSLIITVPEKAPDPYVSVIKLNINGELQVDAVMPEQREGGRVELPPAFADVHNRGYGEKIQMEKKNGKAIITHWVEDRAWLNWTFRIEQPGMFKVFADMSADADSRLTFGLRDGDKTECTVSATGDDTKFLELGELSIETPGICHLELRPIRKQWIPVQLGNVILKPADEL